MIEEGTSAPDFTLLDQHGEAITLSKLKGQPVVLYFYPRESLVGRRRSYQLARAVPENFQPSLSKFALSIRIGKRGDDHGT